MIDMPTWVVVLDRKHMSRCRKCEGVRRSITASRTEVTHTGQQEGCAVGSELAPEGGEEVDELEHADVVLPDKPVVLAGGHPEQDRHHDEAQLLQKRTLWNEAKMASWEHDRGAVAQQATDGTQFCLTPCMSAHDC